MRALNLGFLVVVGAFGAATSCGGPDQPEIEPGGMPFPTGGARPVPTATPTGGTGGTGGRTGAGTGSTSSGGRSQSSSGGSTGCPMEEPDDNDACTLPASGSLKCMFDEITCTCTKSMFSGKTTWDCRETSSSTGGRSSTSTGGRSSTSTGGRSSTSTGGRSSTSTGGRSSSGTGGSAGKTGF